MRITRCFVVVVLLCSCGMDVTKDDTREKPRDGWREVPTVAKTTEWLGSVDTDYEVAGNWGNGQPSTTGDNDTLIMSKDAVRSMLLNIDRTGDDTAAGLNLAKFYSEPGCTVSAGTSATPFIATASEVFVRGSGSVHYKHDDGGGAFTMSDIIVNSRNAIDALTLDVGSATGLIGRATIVDGGVTFKSSIPDDAFNEIIIGRSGTALTPHVTFEDPASSDVLASLDTKMFGGVLVTGRRLNNIFQYGGTVNTTSTNAQISQITIGAGRLNYRNTNLISLITLGGGVVDLSDLGGELTVSRLIECGNGTLIYNPNIVTITNDITGY